LYGFICGFGLVSWLPPFVLHGFELVSLCVVVWSWCRLVVCVVVISNLCGRSFGQ
jgi:hypothetical protein